MLLGWVVNHHYKESIIQYLQDYLHEKDLENKVTLTDFNQIELLFSNSIGTGLYFWICRCLFKLPLYQH